MKSQIANSVQRLGIYATVFLTGAAVMVVELLGTRVIAPFYGASLYVWSSLISVTMIALAAGYFWGGRWADSSERSNLGLTISLAALATLLIPWLARPVLLATDPLGLRGGAFAASFVLFFPSLVLLGMVGPQAIKLATSDLDGVGRNAGSIYAASTLGSVVGTLTLGFFLFPWVGSREILLGTAVVLFTLGLAVSLGISQMVGDRAVTLRCLLPLALGFGFAPFVVKAGAHHSEVGKFKIQSERESLYGRVRVIDEPQRDLRLLTSDASTIGAASISSGVSWLPYQQIVGLIPGLRPDMQRALLIGQGAGHMANVLRDRYGIVTDTLEIDPAVSDAAERYFGFKPSGVATVGDARYEIRHLRGRYDLIIHDCFTGGSEPAHLLTVETLAELRGLLSEQGILALNFVAFADHGKGEALRAVAQTLAQVFSVQRLFVSEPGDDFNDFIFLASSQTIDLGAKTLSATESAWLRERLFQLDAAPGLVLTDNFNPLEHLQTKKSERYRSVMLDWYGPELLIR